MSLDTAARPASAARDGDVARWVPWAATATSLAGLGVSTYLTVVHYAAPAGLACPETATINCERVITSGQSVLLGVPMAVLGLMFFATMTALNLPSAWRSDRLVPRLARLGGAVVGMGFVLYLLYAELFLVGALCLWCTAVHALTFALFALVTLATAAR